MIFNFWYKLNITSKLLLVAVIFLLLWGLKMSIYKYKYFKSIEKERDELVKKSDVLNYKIDSLIVLSKKSTKIAKKRAINIDKKHNNDVKEIINSDVTDDELNSFITRHSN